MLNFLKRHWFILSLTLAALAIAAVAVAFPPALLTAAIAKLAATSAYAAFGAYAMPAAIGTAFTAMAAAVYAVGGVAYSFISLIDFCAGKLFGNNNDNDNDSDDDADAKAEAERLEAERLPQQRVAIDNNNDNNSDDDAENDSDDDAENDSDDDADAKAEAERLLQQRVASWKLQQEAAAVISTRAAPKHFHDDADDSEQLATGQTTPTRPSTYNISFLAHKPKQSTDSEEPATTESRPQPTFASV